MDSPDAFPLGSGTAETPEDFGDKPADIVDRYLTQIRIYDKGVKGWAAVSKRILERYRNKSASSEDGGEVPKGTKRKYALLWSAIQTQTPALFARTPVPIVERRWKDNDDLIATEAAEILQRALIYELDRGDFAFAVKGAVFDYQLAGRGVAWLRKEVDHGEALDDPTNGKDDAPVLEVLDERICVDEVPWPDFGHNLARNWKEVTVGWRRLYMTRDQLRDRFRGKTKDGKLIADAVELDYEPTALDDKTAQLPPHLYKLATVYEIWDRSTLKAVWIALGYKDAPLDQQDDPLKLRDFFPFPRPIYASPDTTSLIPIPDYTMWEDQAREVDELTERLHKLILACRVRGTYNPSFAELSQLFEETLENDMIPVAGWTEFATKGAIKGVIDFVPLEPIITAIGELFEAREQAKRDASEINGVGDIIRGQNAGPEKTATESRISGQFGTLRLQDRQKEVQRFCRDIVQMAGELIAETFTPETLEQMSGKILPTALEKQQAQGIVDQDKAYQAWKVQQPPPGQPMQQQQPQMPAPQQAQPMAAP